MQCLATLVFVRAEETSTKPIRRMNSPSQTSCANVSRALYKLCKSTCRYQLGSKERAACAGDCIRTKTEYDDKCCEGAQRFPTKFELQCDRLQTFPRKHDDNVNKEVHISYSR